MESSRRIAWRPEEDEALTDLINSGITCWRTLSEQLSASVRGSKRSSKQCRERWSNFLDPRLNRGEWSEEERQELFYYHQIYGNCWTKIAYYMPARSECAIKNFFNLSIKKAVKAFNAGANEDEQISTPLKVLIRDKAITQTLRLFEGTTEQPGSPQEAELMVLCQHFQQEVEQGLTNYLETLNNVYQLVLSTVRLQ